MNIMIKSAMLTMISLIVIGCSPPNIQAIKQPKNEKASSIIVYRPDTFANKFNEMIVTIDDVDVTTLHNMEYTAVKVEPGEHKVSVRASAGSDSSESVNIKPTEIVYFEAAGSANNSINFIPGTYLLKSNFYIEKTNGFDATGFAEKKVSYE